MSLGKEAGLGPGHIVLDGDPVGTQPPQQPLPTFGPCLLRPNGHPSQQLLSSCTNGRPKRLAVYYRTVVCHCVCLSITFMYCGQTAGWIRMPLGTKVGLGLGHTVSDGDPVPTEVGTVPLTFGACLSLLCRCRGFCAVRG